MAIIDLEQRTNYSVYDFKGKHIVLYDDHRCLLNVLYMAKQKFGCAHDVFYFDNHDDAKDLNPNEVKEIIGLGTNYSLQNLWNFVEFTSAPEDDSWLNAGFELGLINNAIVFGAEIEDSNVRSLPHNQYIDLRLRHHFAYSILNAVNWSEMYYSYGSVAGIEKKQVDLIKQSSGFILDFDLDCFASYINGIAGGEYIAVPESMFCKWINNQYLKALMNDLINKANVITICMEPGCCGGLGESYRILYLLDKYLFKGCLGTTPKR